MFIAYWIIGMPIGYTLSMTDFFSDPIGAPGMWIGLTVGLLFRQLLLLQELIILLVEVEVDLS